MSRSQSNKPPTTFYTYLYLRSNGTPYYVGKGNRRRAFMWQYHVSCPPRNPDGSVCKARILIQYWESEEKAFEIERWWIAFFGRKDIGTGILRNLSDGGQGPRGSLMKKSEAHKQKLREAALLSFALGRVSPLKGIKFSAETRERMSASAKARGMTSLQLENLKAGHTRIRSAADLCKMWEGQRAYWERWRQERRKVSETFNIKLPFNL